MAKPDDAQCVEFTDVGDRPYIASSVQKPKFRVGDKVYFLNSGSREGPYYIASIPAVGKYTLSSETGAAARNNEEIATGKLEMVKR